MVPVRLFISFAALAVAAGVSAPAQAWEVCNETSFVQRVAVATTIDGAVTPKGWTRARPGQCLTFIADEISPRYVYAESSVAHQGDIREWKGRNRLCADKEDFTANTEVSCALQNMTTRDYLAVDPAEAVTRLVEIEDFGERAATAGVQRLLRDVGYSISKIDGREGRRTRRSLSAFFKDRDMRTPPTEGEIIDALEAAAMEAQDGFGISVCNSAAQNMWLAIARREDAGWEARGWWAVEPDSCLRPQSQSIKGQDAHIFALLETPSGGDDLRLKSGAAVPSQFCIAQSRFSSTGRENCADRGYRAAGFRPLPTDKDGVKVVLSEADFAAPSPDGLRR